MSQPEIFALTNSTFNAFLFADVGTEANGSNLTVLSTLARLGKDPWAEAAQWAKLPASEAITLLAAHIARMPLGANSAAEISATAGRLVRLLPTQSRTADAGTGRRVGSRIPMKWGWLVIGYFWVCLAFNAALAFAPKPPATAPSPNVAMAEHPPASAGAQPVRAQSRL